MQEDFHYVGAIAGQMRFEIDNGPIALIPDVLLVQDRFWQASVFIFIVVAVSAGWDGY